MTKDRVVSIYLTAGAILVGAVFIFLAVVYLSRARATGAQWERSKSYKDMARIEAAGSAELHEIANEARARNVKILGEIARAEATKLDRVENKTADSLREAIAYAAFDLLAAARASARAIMTAPAREGSYSAERWRREIASLEQEAVRSGREGSLSLALRALRKEVSAEGAVAKSAGRDIAAFRAVAPVAFGGTMREAADKTEADVAQLTSQEVGPERELYARANGAMRGRVRAVLVGRVDSLREADARSVRLSRILSGPVARALACASSLKESLDCVVSARGSERSYLALAAMHANDTETRRRADGSTYTVRVDNSFMYRAAASSAASRAQSCASAANEQRRALIQAVEALAADPDAAAEGVSHRDLAGGVSAVSSGSGGLSALVLPPVFGLLSSSGAADAERALGELGQVRTRIDGVKSHLERERAGEEKRIATAIDDELRKQEAAQ